MATAKNRNTTKVGIAAAIGAATLAAAAGAATAEGICQVLQVTAKRDGFRRAGREWIGSTTVPLGELTALQYERLTTEPMLVTLLLEVPEDQVAELTAPDGSAGGETGT